MVQTEARIILNKRIKGNYWQCLFSCPPIAQTAMPGQFINIRVASGQRPFLRRPFSIHDVEGERVRILYEVLGEGTRSLSARKSGEYLNCLGPLGNGFFFPPGRKEFFVFVGGGMGVAPLVYLSKKIKSGEKTVLIGGRCKKDLLCEKEFKDCGCDVRISTDDGSAGLKGRVTGLLENYLREKRENTKKVWVYACGPTPMLKAVCALPRNPGVTLQVSLEEHMSCGIGACLGCVVKTKKGLERVCKEGPVFYAQDLIW